MESDKLMLESISIDFVTTRDKDLREVRHHTQTGNNRELTVFESDFI